MGKAYYNRYDGKLNVWPDFEKAEHWYSEALKLGLKVSLFYLGKLYHSKFAQTDEDAVMEYTYYNAFYMLTSQDKDRFSSLRGEANQGMESMEGAAKEGRVKFFLALRQSNSAVLERLLSRLKFS